MENNKLVQNWEVAKSELGLDIVTPFEIDVGDNIKLRADILVRNFGGKNGMIIVTDYARIKPYLRQLRNLGYGFSVLNGSDEPYDREVFIEMLSEWEWIGNEVNKPKWIIPIPVDE